MKRLGLPLVAVGAVIAVGLVSLFYWREARLNSELGEGTPKPETEAASTSSGPRASTLQRSKAQVAVQGAVPSTKLPDWNAVEKKYGEALTPNFDSNGKLTSIRGQAEPEKRGKTSFDPKVESSVRKRALEILEDLSELMGVDPKTFTDIQMRTGEISAQIFFKQTVDGLPVLPVGNTSLVLGPSGEILEMSTDALGSIKIENSVSIPVEQAKAYLGDPLAEGGRLVVWSDTSGAARKAYDFVSRGQQVVVDAQNGNILFKRDRRQY
jgi:hypothetical protein